MAGFGGGSVFGVGLAMGSGSDLGTGLVGQGEPSPPPVVGGADQPLGPGLDSSLSSCSKMAFNRLASLRYCSAGVIV